MRFVLTGRQAKNLIEGFDAMVEWMEGYYPTHPDESDRAAGRAKGKAGRVVTEIERQMKEQARK